MLSLCHESIRVCRAENAPSQVHGLAIIRLGLGGLALQATDQASVGQRDDVVGVVGIPANAAATPVTPDPNWSSPSAWRVREATMCAVAPRVSPTLQMHYIPRSFGALAAQSRRNEAETERFLHERTRSASTIGIVI